MVTEGREGPGVRGRAEGPGVRGRAEGPGVRGRAVSVLDQQTEGLHTYRVK